MPYVNFNQPDLDAKYDDVKILQYNVHRTNKNIGEMARWIISQSEDVDIVVLSEVTEGWDDALRRIKWAYPYHIKEDMRGGRQMVIFSRLYIDEFEIKYIGKEKAPMLVMRGDTSGYEIPFVLYGIHPPPPVLPSYAARRNELLQLAAENIAKETAVHKLIVADFNTTRFSPVFKNMVTVSGLHDSNEGLGLGAFNTTWPSFFKNFMGIAIDNIVLSDNIKVEDKEIGPALGSDHYPVITTLKFLVDKGK
jgi:endonuclease/exonuclease/phosphatase (EEP) superfamily protein YafD